MAQLGFLLDVNKCTGCRCCQVACKDKNDLPVGSFFRWTVNAEVGIFPQVWAGSISLGCNHCNDPACARTCPVGAIRKDETLGVVIQDIKLCIGCKKCTKACPYGAPTYIESLDVVRKCDACVQWVVEGLQPACAGACSTRALRFGDISKLKREFSEEYGVEEVAFTHDLPFLPSSLQTDPNTIYISNECLTEDCIISSPK